MKFTVTFGTSESAFNPIDFSTKNIGLDLVDLARSVSALPNISLTLFDEFVKGYGTNVSIEIDEQEARRSGLFKETNNVWVEVPGQFLNKYARLAPMFYRDSKDGKITRVGFEYHIAKITILVDWMSCSYPKTWGFDGIQNTCANDQC